MFCSKAVVQYGSHTNFSTFGNRSKLECGLLHQGMMPMSSGNIAFMLRNRVVGEEENTNGWTLRKKGKEGEKEKKGSEKK